MERKPFVWSELFSGNWELFKNALQNPETIFVYDVDGILANTYKIVTENFTEKTGIQINPVKIGQWDFLTVMAQKAGLSEETILHAEDDWYNPEVLRKAQRYLYTRPLVRKTVNYYGPDRNYILTSRNPYLAISTIDWFAIQFPEIKKNNILIRDKGGIDMADSINFKVNKIEALSRKAPWVIFVDDSAEFTRAVIDANIRNCLVVNVPVGNIMPNFRHERLFVIKRFPEQIQAMYPLMHAVDKAINSI